MSRLLIGTSGYSYEDWREHFYPIDLPKNKMLEFYANHFKVAEINATYYKIPAKKTFERMLLKTSPDFEFIIKTHQETTHKRVENESALDQLKEAVSPLIDAGKFSGFLAQFPYSFKNNEQNRRYLADTKKYIKDYPLFIEFRHISWIRSEVFRFLSDLDIGYVNVDEPPLKGLVPVQEVVTSKRAYIRFHGRNSKDWWDGVGSARYDYEYNEDELKEWLVHISRILKKAYKTYVFFNNHPNGQAVRNAKQLIELLENNHHTLFENQDKPQTSQS